VLVQGQATNLLELLRQYRDYSQFRDARGEWDRELLHWTLLAKSLAARYLLMNEDPVLHADQTVENLRPQGIQTPLSPEDFHPGESWATYFGRKADEAIRQLRAVEAENRTLEEQNRQLKENQRQMIARRRQK